MKRAKVLSDSEFKRVLTIASAKRHGARNRLALSISFYTGMRVSEIASIKVGDVINSNGTIKDRISLKASITKNNKTRTIFISSKLKKELARYFKSHQATNNLDDPLLKSQKGSHFSANSLCQWFSAIYEESGLTGVTSHSGRRTFITKMASGGINPRIIMELAGHSSLSVTQSYIEIEDAAIARAVEVI